MTKDPERNEWYFEECPPDEAYECCAYEYARESKFQKEIIAQWRRSAKGNKIEDYLELSHGIYDPPPGTGTYAYFPSWPDKPFLSVLPNTRKLWYEILGIPAILDDLFNKAIEVNSWDEGENRKLLEGFDKGGQPAYLDGSCQYVVFAIEWAEHDKALIEKFQSWLKKNRPKDRRAIEMRGRGNPSREWRLKLEYLRFYRLLKVMSIYEAIAFLDDKIREDENLKLRRYEYPQSCEDAAKKAEEIIRWFEQPLQEVISKRFLEACSEKDYSEDYYPES
jgi:hypothetical protein